MEHGYKGKWSTAFLGDYCWMMKQELLKQNSIDRTKGHVVKVSIFLFLFIVHIILRVLLSRKAKLTNEIFKFFASPAAQKNKKDAYPFKHNFNHKISAEKFNPNLWRAECIINAR